MQNSWFSGAVLPSCSPPRPSSVVEIPCLITNVRIDDEQTSPQGCVTTIAGMAYLVAPKVIICQAKILHFLSKNLHVYILKRTEEPDAACSHPSDATPRRSTWSPQNRYFSRGKSLHILLKDLLVTYKRTRSRKWQPLTRARKPLSCRTWSPQIDIFKGKDSLIFEWRMAWFMHKTDFLRSRGMTNLAENIFQTAFTESK